ncbi:SEC23-interacting protein-like isoform X1 [Athalia rosae]|uniref:SEC23-interacting protein-like isoform X1 n=1 Tax=Athalia rosae TaxID=37344 RepID=UPI0020342537|nr:SEC23-interacting protein-like isoform X1 [Athalia rosae]
MGDTSRKVKNPLLSAAGVGFPFEDFSGNVVLMPVTPATSSVLQDEGEIASFVGQTKPAPSSSYPKEFNAGQNALPEHSPRHPLLPPTQQQQQQQQQSAPVTSEICLAPTDEHRDSNAESQPQKQGYLSSLLSSLPNISLASITGDREDASARSSLKDQSGSSEYPTVYPYYNPSPGQPSYPSNVGPPNQQINPYETPATARAPGNWYQPENTSGGAPFPPANIPSTSSPTVQPPPVALPPTGTPSSSYRLGNQRRLKYAPPPDLTTSNPRGGDIPANLPPLPSFPSVATPSLYHQIPAAQSTPSYPTSFESNIPRNFNRESTRSSPGVDVTRVTSPQSIPSRISSIDANVEPATPQNTPANPTHLSGFGPPTSGLDSWSLSASANPWKNTPETNIRPKNTEDDVLKEVDLREASPAPLLPVPSAPESSSAPKSEARPASSSPFAPISAARVSEKLEHLLAERKDFFPESPVSLGNDPVDLNPTEKPVAQDIGAQTIPATPVTVPGDAKSPDTAGARNTAVKNLVEPRSTANYFSPAHHAEFQTPIPSFYDPNKSLGQIKTPPGIPGLVPEASVKVPEAAPVPTFYNPTQYTPAGNPKANANANLQNLQPFSSLGIIPGENFSQNFYTPSNQINPGSTLAGVNFGRDDTASYFLPPSPPMAAAVPEPTGSATLDPIQMSVNPLGSSGYSNNLDNGLTALPPSLHNLAAGGTSTIKQMPYRPVYQHWFLRKEVETKVLWLPFSMQDSLNLEEVHNSNEITPETKVPTDGGRYDVDILGRLRTPVYWTGKPNEVRRCSWFYKGPAESRYVPYEENVAARLEEEYRQAFTSDIWNRRIELNNGEYIVFHSSTVQVHYLQPGSPELTATWGNNGGSEDSTYLQGATLRPRVVKRGVDEFNIDEGEPDQVDHLLFLVHGIGSVCDLKFRSVEEVVDEFRSISLQLVQSHYRTASENGTVHKIEVLPISWHTTLHSEDTGIDKKLQAITLDSIPKLRHFTNDTLSDILFYTSPIYCQTIMQTVGNEMNRLHALFKKRNPTFEGGIYVGGHSLGSLILFDLLCHQKPPKEEETVEKVDEEKEKSIVPSDGVSEDTVGPIRETKPILKRRLSRKISYVMGSAGTGQPFINYPQLNFNPNAFFALGSPIGMFVTVRGIDTLGEEFALPTCPSFFNIFHPFDPVAYRVEALIHPDASKLRPKLIPHHKGRKRMHLELKETMARVGADLKQRLLDSVRNTWNSVYQLAMFHRPDNQALEREIDKVVEEQLQSASNEPETSQQQTDDSGDDIKIGKLNGGRRVDYVLQEAPFEYINEYIFALTSHVCYWESEDTMLLILKEIYGSMGIQSDAQLPQQTLTIERASSPSPLMNRANTSTYSPTFPSPGVSAARIDGKSPAPFIMGMDPTAPISDRPVGPPPTSGFMRKS